MNETRFFHVVADGASLGIFAGKTAVDAVCEMAAEAHLRS